MAAEGPQAGPVMDRDGDSEFAKNVANAVLACVTDMPCMWQNVLSGHQAQLR